MMIRRSERVVSFVVLAVFAVLILLPILGVVLLSLHPDNARVSGFSVPDSVHLETYKEAWTTASFSTYMRSSAIVSAAVVTGTLVVSVLAGYSFGTMRFRGQTVLFYLLLAGMIVPFEAVIVPLYF